jgi:hypothetical protein
MSRFEDHSGEDKDGTEVGFNTDAIFLSKRNDSHSIRQIYDKWLCPSKSHLLNLRPTYQRDLAWDFDAFNNFLDSVHRNYIFNPIILCKLNNFGGGGGARRELDRFECMDGQHRLTCIQMYMNGETVFNSYLYLVKERCRVFYKAKDKTNEQMDRYIDVENRKKTRHKYRYMDECEKEHFDAIEFNFQIIQDDLNNHINVKAEIFNRVQNGARVNNFELIKNKPHVLCVFLRENVLPDKIFKYELMQKIIFYQRVNNYIIIENIMDKTQNECYLYFLLRVYYIYQHQTISFGMYDMNLNIKKKLDEEIKTPDMEAKVFSKNPQDFQKIWDAVKIVFGNIPVVKVKLAEPIFYYLFYTYNFDKNLYDTLNKKLQCPAFMEEYNNVLKAKQYYVVSMKMKSQLITDTFNTIKQLIHPPKSKPAVVNLSTFFRQQKKD